MVTTENIGYIGLFPEGDAVANLDSGIIVFGTLVAFKEYLSTLEGEPISDITFNLINYDEIFREGNSGRFALDEVAFGIFREAATKHGQTIPTQNFDEPNEDLIKFATIRTKTILR